jgi:pectinesterase
MAQIKIPERDTSYTIYSTYKKEVQNFLFIEPAFPILPSKVNALRELTYVNYGDRELKVDVFYKESVKENLKPALILVHGGGWRTGDRSLTFPLALQLADKGYVTFSIEYRLSPEAIFPAAIIDVNNAIKWTKENAEQFYVDSNKIALLGCSAGAQIVSLVGFANNIIDFEDSVHYSEISNNISATVNIDGLLDFLGEGSEEFDQNPDNRKPRSAHKWLGASQLERPDLWRKASGINYINSNSPPIIFINSSKPRFRAGRDEAIEILNKFDIYYEVHTLENTPHSFWLFHPWFNETLNYTANFLDNIFRKKMK